MKCTMKDISGEVGWLEASGNIFVVLLISFNSSGELTIHTSAMDTKAVLSSDSKADL